MRTYEKNVCGLRYGVTEEGGGLAESAHMDPKSLYVK
jgi:hypothetical protein